MYVPLLSLCTFLTRSTAAALPLCCRYIRDLATLVVAYGISINLVEVTWKSKIKAQFPNPNDYSAFMGDFSTATGAVTFTMMILSRYIFKYFGWGVAALITPTVLLITGIAFFCLVLFSDSVAPTLKALGLTPLMAAVLVGAAQNVFSKSSKYSLFDPCKEMAYIPLDDEVSWQQVLLQQLLPQLQQGGDDCTTGQLAPSMGPWLQVAGMVAQLVACHVPPCTSCWRYLRRKCTTGHTCGYSLHKGRPRHGHVAACNLWFTSTQNM